MFLFGFTEYPPVPCQKNPGTRHDQARALIPPTGSLTYQDSDMITSNKVGNSKQDSLGHLLSTEDTEDRGHSGTLVLGIYESKLRRGSRGW